MPFDLENFPTSESAKRMLSYVSDGFYDKSYVGKWLYQVMGLEYDSAQTIIETLPDQIFPETATWGLCFHEIKWGLPVKEELSYEERRKLIVKKRDVKKSMTPYQMESIISKECGCEVEVQDIHDKGAEGYDPGHPNIFRILVRSEGDNVDVGAVFKLAGELKQSHTVCEIRVASVARLTVKATRTADKAVYRQAGTYPTTQIGYSLSENILVVDRMIPVAAQKTLYPLCGEEMRL